MADKTRAPWLSIVLSGLLCFVVSMAITAATVAGYAMVLAIKAQGPPDADKIAAFAGRYIPFLGPVVLSLLVLIAARWVVRPREIDPGSVWCAGRCDCGPADFDVHPPAGFG